MEDIKENVQDGEVKGKRRSDRLAAKKLNESSSTNSINENTKPKPLADSLNTKKDNQSKKDDDEPFIIKRATKRPSRSAKSKNNLNDDTQKNSTEEKPKVVKSTRSQTKGDTLNYSLKSMSIANNTETDKPQPTKNILLKSNNNNNAISTAVVTPTSQFKTRECIRTPLSGTRGTPGRIGVSPNPRNFLCKAEDPVLQRIESPKPEPFQKSSQASIPKSAMYFHQLVDKEEAKFKDCCAKWNKILAEDNVPEQAQGNILAAIGQALLFQNKRFKQFKELIELHKDKSAEKAAYASDLHGFWEMIYYQVEDVHKRFDEIELLRSNNWVEKKVELVTKPKVIKKVIPQNETKEKTKKLIVSSKFKMFRQQMMVKKKAEERNSDAMIF